MAVGHSLIPTPIMPKSMVDFWADTERLMQRVRQRAFEIFEARGREDGHDVDDWIQAELESLKQVPIKIEDTPETLSLRAETPGLNADEIKIDLLPGKVTIQGDHHEQAVKKGPQAKAERNYSLYSEVFLPADVIPEKATATLKNGILEISAPKAKAALQIQVKAA